ncbi:translation initiation factor IF-3 [Candidatus Gottesmanbacteria bacterium RBG_16_52_11]|uniref:Translation initiation factor IF-3 n=1 Tax=Candidatus Gottesmanbacteria bacterium RBG_16_52_11 TaxID=1798374 RepID=A0A1F5YP48_9BACT|nr:MAG: translation initiation factor IF-3 [Candidatus Gottesmanbacteria bacterium RBG_16_52_11]
MKKFKTSAKHYRINYQIPSLQLRLLDETGKQIGVVSKIEALQKARELSLDVVEVAPKATPPVAKLIDFKKFKYQESKKERESKKLTKNVGVKEMRLRPFIGGHDFDTRVAQGKEFLEEGNQVKINVVFKGREITRKEFGFDVIRRYITAVDAAKTVRDPHFEGRVLSATVVGTKKEEYAESQNEKNRCQEV